MPQSVYARSEDTTAAPVLIVDDDAEIRRIYAHALEKAGHPCFTAAGSEEAIGVLRAHADIDVVVSDIRMPEEDGIAFLQRIREGFADRPWLQVLLISGAPSLDAAIGGLRLQARDLLQKPVKPRELVETVERCAESAERVRRQDRQQEKARETIARLVSEFDQALERFSTQENVVEPPSRGLAGEGVAITPARLERLIRWQRDRNRLFKERYFSDPAWYMLLDLYLGEITGRETSVTSLCLASDVPVTTALRRLDELEEDGVLVRQPDPADRRRINVTLLPEARQRMTDSLTSLLELMEPVPQQT